MDKDDGSGETTFSNMVSKGVHHFNTLFKKDYIATIATILKIARFFPLLQQSSR